MIEPNHYVFVVVDGRMRNSLSYLSSWVVQRLITSMAEALPRYFALILLIMLLNYSLIYVLNEHAGIPLFFAKVLTECVYNCCD